MDELFRTRKKSMGSKIPILIVQTIFLTLLLSCNAGQFGGSDNKGQRSGGYDGNVHEGTMNDCDQKYIADCYLNEDIIESVEELKRDIDLENISSGREKRIVTILAREIQKIPIVMM